MKKETFKLKQTIASRLTTMENLKFSKLVEKSNTTKSEMIRMLIVNFSQNEMKKKLLTN